MSHSSRTARTRKSGRCRDGKSKHNVERPGTEGVRMGILHSIYKGCEVVMKWTPKT